MAILRNTQLGNTCPKRSLASINKLIVHRTECGVNAQEVATYFKLHPLVTGGKMGYHYIICKNGNIEQAVEHGRMSMGARWANASGINIALIGDFTRKDPTSQQVDALKSLLGSLCIDLKLTEKDIYGHTELKNASADPKKVCPGRKLDLDAIRLFVKTAIGR